jgi:hypothetical protein
LNAQNISGASNPDCETSGNLESHHQMHICAAEQPDSQLPPHPKVAHGPAR